MNYVTRNARNNESRTHIIGFNLIFCALLDQIAISNINDVRSSHGATFDVGSFCSYFVHENELSHANSLQLKCNKKKKHEISIEYGKDIKSAKNIKRY